MNRMDVTEKIISTKVSKGLKWEDIAKKSGAIQGVDHCTVPGPDDSHASTGQSGGKNLWTEC